MIETSGGGTCAEWDAYVARCPRATCYHLSAWTEIVKRAYHVRAFRVVSREAPGAPVRGVVPLVVVPRPFGRYVTTGAFGSYGPMLADGDEAAAELFEAAKAITDRVRARYLHVKSLGDEPPPPGFERQDVWVTARLALDRGAEGVWAGLRKGVRAAVRQAGKNGFELRRGKAELEGFYDVLADNMHRKGSPIYGLSFIRGMVEAFGDRAEVFTLHEGGRAVSGAVSIEHGGVLYVPFASSRAAVFHKRPNNLLYWTMIDHACTLGLGTFDFGTSMRDTSALAFKRHWGASVEPVASYVYTREVERPDLGPSSPAVQRGVSMWKRLPRDVADALGPSICRFML